MQNKTGFLVLIAMTMASTSFGMGNKGKILLPGEEAATKVDQELSAKASELAKNTDAWLEKYLTLLRQRAAVSDIQSMDASKQKPILQSMVKEYPEIFIVHTLGPDGKNIARSDAESMRSFADRPWFQNALNGQSFGMQVQVSRSYGAPVLAIGIPIINDQSKIVGVLGMGIKLSDIATQLSNTKIGNTGYTFILNERGNVVSHPKKAFTQVLADFSRHPAVIDLRDKKKVVFNDDVSGKKVIAVSQKIKYGWIVVVQQDYDEAFPGFLERFFSKDK